jgi:hypothetical protein
MPVVTATTPTAVAVSADAVPTDGGTAAAVVEQPVAAAADTQGVDTTWALGAFVLVVGGALAAWGLYEWIKPDTIQVGAGFSAFAPLYILAQGIERLLEPFSNHLARAKDEEDASKKKSKNTATNERNEAFAAVASPPAGSTVEDVVTTAAKAQAFLDRVRRNTAVIAWGLASALAMIACGAFGIRLLDAIGFDVPPFWDVALTGLAIGSGTKPLHDLISNIQKSKDAKADTPKPVTAA